jgi:hypothetical protein
MRLETFVVLGLVMEESVTAAVEWEWEKRSENPRKYYENESIHCRFALT